MESLEKLNAPLYRRCYEALKALDEDGREEAINLAEEMHTTGVERG
jgi:hypothetical protein